jgi:hypothetical protein
MTAVHGAELTHPTQCCRPVDRSAGREADIADLASVALGDTVQRVRSFAAGLRTHGAETGPAVPALKWLRRPRPVSRTSDASRR